MNLLFPVTFSFKKRIKINQMDSNRSEQLMESLNHFLSKRGFKTIRKSGETTRFYDPDAFMSGLMHHSGRINNGTLTATKQGDSVELRLTCVNYFTLAFVLLSGILAFVFSYQIQSLGQSLILPAIIVGISIAANSIFRYLAHKKFVAEMESLAVRVVRS